MADGDADATARLDQMLARFDRERQRSAHGWNLVMGGVMTQHGLMSEEQYRSNMRDLLAFVGAPVERLVYVDVDGFVRRPGGEVEIEVAGYNGKTILVEARGDAEGDDVYRLVSKSDLYTHQTGRTVDKMLLISPCFRDKALPIAREMGVEICKTMEDVEALLAKLSEPAGHCH